MVNVCNSLRFIDDYEVVHMDLNLNNILVCKDYLTKLIDFDESFSPRLNSSHVSTFKRGHTFPFCSPEYFERKGKFTIKQDVFSLGMIMYRLVFG
jgi:serine/threonine protein kinase